MNQIIDSQTQRKLKEKFKNELKNEVDIKVFTRKISLKEEDPRYADFAEKFIRELSSIDSRIKPQFLSLEDKFAKELQLETSPTILIGQDMGYKIIFNGAPLGMEAGSFIETISFVSRGETNLSKESKDKLNNIDKDVKIRVFVTPTCPYCPQSVILANQIAIESKGKVTAECVEANENAELSAKFNVMSVPQQVINDEIDSITIGVQPEEKFVEHVLKYGVSNYKPENKGNKLENDPDKPIKLTDANFKEATKKYKNLVVDFWAPWCGACKMITPVIEELAKIYKGKITFAKLNTDENQKIAIEHGIMSIPTLIVFKDGKKVDRLVGAMSRKELEERLKNIFESV